MVCFSDAITTHFLAAGGDANLIPSLEVAYARLISLRRDWVDYGDIDAISEVVRANANCKVLQQTLIHRAEKLMTSSATMLAEDNIYGLALVVRGHIEATAMLGYCCQRLQSFMAGNISLEDLEWNIASAGLGAKHEQFAAAPKPINIMTCIEKTDRYLEAHGFPVGTRMVADSYNWLSEFAHPNFLSHSSALEPQGRTGRMRILHDVELGPKELSTLGYLEISAGLFLQLFDDLGEHATRAFAAS
jgi:hypothetical protein